jgi:hypothetical protein
MSGCLSLPDMFLRQGRYDAGTDQYNRLSELTSAHDALVLDPRLPPRFQDDCVFDPSRNQLTRRAGPVMIGPISAKRLCFMCISRLHPTACIYCSPEDVRAPRSPGITGRSSMYLQYYPRSATSPQSSSGSACLLFISRRCGSCDPRSMAFWATIS